MTSQYFAADTSSVKPEEAWNDWGDWGDGNINNNNNNNISSNAMSQSHQVQPVQVRFNISAVTKIVNKYLLF